MVRFSDFTRKEIDLGANKNVYDPWSVQLKQIL